MTSFWRSKISFSVRIPQADAWGQEWMGNQQSAFSNQRSAISNQQSAISAPGFRETVGLVLLNAEG
jgi:hypothetical protein